MPNKCYPKNKEKLWKKACERYQNLSEKKKKKKAKKDLWKMSKFYWGKKSVNIIVNLINIFLKIKKEKLVDYRSIKNNCWVAQ